MAAPETIGIIGAHGDLGRRMTVQVASGPFKSILTSDLPGSEPPELEVGVDASVNAGSMLVKPELVFDSEEIFERADVVHFCAPIDVAKDIASVPADTLLVFHASVMDESLQAAQAILQKRKPLGSLAVVHCLMNEYKKVSVATDFGDTDAAAAHITDLGLVPHLEPSLVHDLRNASSTGILAVIYEHSHRDLVEWDRQGLLTASASELTDLMENRDANWTKASLASIKRNPHLISAFGALLADVIDAQAQNPDS